MRPPGRRVKTCAPLSGAGRRARYDPAHVARRSTRPTLEDVAARAGVSRALVSLVIRGVAGQASAQTRERVLQAAAELGYRPDAQARLLARNRSQLLGVVYNVRHAFHAELVDRLYAAAEEAEYELVLSGLTPCGGTAWASSSGSSPAGTPRKRVRRLPDFSWTAVRCPALSSLSMTTPLSACWTRSSAQGLWYQTTYRSWVTTTAGCRACLASISRRSGRIPTAWLPWRWKELSPD